MSDSTAAAAWKNRVELSGTVASVPERRRTPAGTVVSTFRLRVPPSPADPAVSGCLIPVVVLGAKAAGGELAEGRQVEVEGSIAERRWRGPGGTQQSRFEILAHKVRVL